MTTPSVGTVAMISVSRGPANIKTTCRTPTEPRIAGAIGPGREADLGLCRKLGRAQQPTVGGPPSAPGADGGTAPLSSTEPEVPIGPAGDSSPRALARQADRPCPRRRCRPGDAAPAAEGRCDRRGPERPAPGHRGGRDRARRDRPVDRRRRVARAGARRADHRDRARASRGIPDSIRPEYARLVAEHNDAVALHNDLVARQRRLNDDYKAQVDRHNARVGEANADAAASGPCSFLPVWLRARGCSETD